MKGLVTILIIFSLCTQCVVQLGILAWYQVNKEYITKEYCVNKDKPQMKCCGRCYLHKQLKKVSESEKPGSQKSEQIEFLAFLVPGKILFSVNNFNVSKQKYYIDHSIIPSSLFIDGIFRPPQHFA